MKYVFIAIDNWYKKIEFLVDFVFALKQKTQLKCFKSNFFKTNFLTEFHYFYFSIKVNIKNIDRNNKKCVLKKNFYFKILLKISDMLSNRLK